MRAQAAGPRQEHCTSLWIGTGPGNTHNTVVRAWMEARQTSTGHDVPAKRGGRRGPVQQVGEQCHADGRGGRAGTGRPLHDQTDEGGEAVGQQLQLRLVPGPQEDMSPRGPCCTDDGPGASVVGGCDA
ncbi:hypothetical protein [Ornithinimicrobium kibberense]|uniref:hypothetical protein n=1 Tax=Ornithinimicrobium kibberense TaxID=282060 RepID=UPI00361C4108